MKTTAETPQAEECDRAYKSKHKKRKKEIKNETVVQDTPECSEQKEKHKRERTSLKCAGVMFQYFLFF